MRRRAGCAERAEGAPGLEAGEGRGLRLAVASRGLWSEPVQPTTRLTQEETETRGGEVTPCGSDRTRRRVLASDKPGRPGGRLESEAVGARGVGTSGGAGVREGEGGDV